MKKTTFLKTLLAGVLLALGSNGGWAQTTLYERGTTNAWTSADVAEGAWSAGTIGTSGLEVTNGVASNIAIAPSSNTSILTWTATWNPGNATGTANNTNAYIQFGDVKFAFYGSSWFTKVTIGSTTTQLSGVGATRGRDYTISVTINQTTNEVSYSFTDNGNTVTGSGTTTSAGSFNTLTHGLGGKIPSWQNTATLKKVEITEKENTAQTANYTVKYVCDGVEIKDAVTRTGEVGAAIELRESDKGTIYNDDSTVKYSYSTDDVAGKTVAADGSTVITITFVKLTQYTYTVKAVDKDNNDLGVLGTKTVFSDETVGISWSKYIKANEQWHVSTESSFSVEATAAGEKTVIYEESDIYYFTEAEGMTPSRSAAANATGAGLSNNYAFGMYGGSTLTSKDAMEEGAYNVYVAAKSRRSGTTTIKLNYLDSENNEVETGKVLSWSNAGTENIEWNIPNFELPAGSYLLLREATNANSVTNIDYLTLTKVKAQANYTVKYVCDGAEIKEAVVCTGEVGATVTLEESDKESFKNADNTFVYTYSSDDASTNAIAADNSTIITVTFTKQALFTYTVKAVDAEDNPLTVLATETAVSGETISMYWSKYIKVEDQWYVTNENTFYIESTEAGEKSVMYEKSDIAYFIECEKMNGVRNDRIVTESSASNSGYYKIRQNSYYRTIYTDAIEEGGVYDLTLPYNNSNGSNSTSKIQTRTSDGTTTDVAEWTCEGGAKTYVLKNIVISAGSSLAIYYEGSGNSNARMDYLTLTPTKESVTVNEFGTATYVTTNALDFTDIETVKAYTASFEGDGKVHFNKVTKVPAGTPLLVTGTTTAIPAIMEATAPETNLLVAGTGAAVESEAEGKYNFILNAKDGVVGFYKANGQTVAADRAYLSLATDPTADPAGKLNIVFSDGQTTGIAEVEAAKNGNAEAIYNVAGQQVGRITKGIFIKNGKKYVK